VTPSTEACFFLQQDQQRYDLNRYQTMIITYKKDEGLEIDTDDEELEY